jgi:hypothetical protein
VKIIRTAELNPKYIPEAVKCYNFLGEMRRKEKLMDEANVYFAKAQKLKHESTIKSKTNNYAEFPSMNGM